MYKRQLQDRTYQSDFDRLLAETSDALTEYPYTQKAHASGSLSGCVGFFGHRLFLVLQLFMGFLLDDQPR